MEIITEKKITDKTLSGLSPISHADDDPLTIPKPSSDETAIGDDLGSVVVTTTVVEETEVSVVKLIQEHKEERYLGKSVDKDEGLQANCSKNGTVPVTDPMDICSSVENKKTGGNGAEVFEWKEDESEQEEDHDFVVGDFVWAKIKSHPCWPGQIYDPCDASDYAATLKRKGRLLVACFGDGSFSWCSPSQLKPFIDHFEHMSNQSSSKKFVNAVQTALEEVSRLVEGELTSDITEKACVVNRGVKEGVHVPKGNTVKVLIDRLEPVALVSSLKGYATMEPGAGFLELELALLKSYLRAFYKKGGYVLVEYSEPKCIEGLEEESVAVADSDTIGVSESPENGDDKLYGRRKQKSVAELLGEDESKIKKAKASRDGGVKDRKRKLLVVAVEPESEYESGGAGVEEETMSPRQRKKSKYLSPPYLSPVGTGKLSALGSGSGSGSFKEPKPELEKVEDMAAEPLEDSLKKSNGKRGRPKRRVVEGSDSQEHVADVNVTEGLNGLLLVALDQGVFVEEAIMEFVALFRGSVFRDGGPGTAAAGNKTGQKKDVEKEAKKDVEKDACSDVAFMKQKLVWMREMVQKSEMNADVKASLGTGIQEVLEKVVKMKGK